jgi:hypothetical protein
MQGGTVRPKTIVYFQWIFLGTLLLGILQSYLGWAATSHRSSAAVAIIIWFFSFVLGGTLTLLVSRRRSKVAMWVSITLCAVALSGFFVEAITRGVRLGSNMNVVMTALQFIGQVVVYGLLFTPSAGRWMNREDKVFEVFH